MDKNRKRSGQLRKIPAFGNWDSADDLPITQYFESARDAGLARFSSSFDGFPAGDLYSVDSCKRYHNNVNFSAPDRTRKVGGVEKRRPPHSKEAPTAPTTATKSKKLAQHDVVAYYQQPPVPPTSNRRPPKAVDEDLYKIPPELLHHTQRNKKKKLGFISRCLAMTCTA